MWNFSTIIMQAETAPRSKGSQVPRFLSETLQDNQRLDAFRRMLGKKSQLSWDGNFPTFHLNGSFPAGALFRVFPLLIDWVPLHQDGVVLLHFLHFVCLRTPFQYLLLSAPPEKERVLASHRMTSSQSNTCRHKPITCLKNYISTNLLFQKRGIPSPILTQKLLCWFNPLRFWFLNFSVCFASATRSAACTRRNVFKNWRKSLAHPLPFTVQRSGEKAASQELMFVHLW